MRSAIILLVFFHNSLATIDFRVATEHYSPATYYTCKQISRSCYKTFSSTSSLFFFIRTRLRRHLSGRCNERCADLCDHQDCLNDFQVADDGSCICIRSAKSRCGENAVCSNDVCECLDGFTGIPEDKCVDIDECEGSDPCEKNQFCVNSQGSYTCESSRLQKAVFPSKIGFRLDPWLPQEDPSDNAQRLAIPSLTQPFYNMVLDVRATVSAANTSLIFSTNGNWMAGLMKLLNTKYFPENPSVKDSYLITTSPPISIAQMTTGIVKVGNVIYKDAQAHVVAGPGGFLDMFEAKGYGLGDRIPIIRTYGNVILKRKRDPNIKRFSDLTSIKPGRFASSDPAEGGSYNNYRETIFNLVVNNPELLGVTQDKAARAAANLQARLFDKASVATIGAPMHRSVPHMIATGQADAGLFFLHLAVVAMQENPGLFEAIYLAKDKVGSTDDPSVLLQGQDPLEGNRVGTFFVLRTTTSLNTEQETARENFIQDLQSAAFTRILAEVGLRRPD